MSPCRSQPTSERMDCASVPCSPSTHIIHRQKEDSKNRMDHDCGSFAALAVVAVSGKRLLEIPSTLCPAICFAGMAIVLLSHRDAALVKLFEWRWLRALGKYSYGMYVIQLPMVTLIPMASLAGMLPSNPLMSATIYLACVFAFIFLAAATSLPLV